MNEISKERRLEILRALGNDVCDGCGRTKQPKRSHCRLCYYALPRQLQSDLYKRFGYGYEEAYEKSLQFLREKLTS